MLRGLRGSFMRMPLFSRRLVSTGMTSSFYRKFQPFTGSPLFVSPYRSYCQAKPRKVLVIYTGGTMGMTKNSENALRPMPGYLTSQLENMEELKTPNMPSVEVVEYDPIMDSSDMTPTDWATVVQDISKGYLSYDGFVVIMGTDTMAYAASAFSFMLERLGKPVILTGSMIPLCEVFSDARRNLLVSLLIAANLDIPEVCVFFNNALLRGNRTTKISSSSLDAFNSPNYPPLGTLGVSLDINKSLLLDPPKQRFNAFDNMGPMPVVFKITPGCDMEFALRALAKAKNRSLVLELFGTGNLPSKKKSFLESLDKVTKAGKIVVAATQCLKGSVELEMYAVAKHLKEIGVISVNDMTTAAATCKLSYLIGKGFSNEDIKLWMETDIRGELTQKVHHDPFNPDRTEFPF